MKNVMIMALLIVAVVFVLMLAGCTPNAQFVRAVDQHTAIILTEYKGYVAADTGLDPTTKRIRIESAATLEELIATAKAEVSPDAE